MRVSRYSSDRVCERLLVDNTSFLRVFLLFRFSRACGSVVFEFLVQFRIDLVVLSVSYKLVDAQQSLYQ